MRYAYVSNFVNPDVLTFFQTREYKFKMQSAELPPQERQRASDWVSTHGLPFMFSGIYNWGLIFSGTFLEYPKTPVEELLKYDVLHINYFHQNLHLISTLRKTLDEIGSDAKIVVNLDYSVDLWHADPLVDISALRVEFDCADVVFAVEPAQQEMLEFLLQRKVHLCPNPVDIDGLRYHIANGSNTGLPLESRTWTNPLTNITVPQLVVNLHRWDAIARGNASSYEGNVNYLTPWAVVAPPGRRKLPCRAVLANLPRSVTEEAAVKWGSDNILHPDILPTHFLRWVSQCRAAFDVYSISSYGRFSAETAALGVPTVGSNCVASMKECWPKLAVEPSAFKQQHELLHQLLTDDVFWIEQVDYAAEHVQYYAYTESRERFLKMLEDNE